ncbi:hypothetical protein GCM10023115_45580 [Pontixanthobacter gangjinensis]
MSLFAQNGEADMETIDKLHKEYKSNGADAALSMYKNMPEDKEYHGLQEPLNVLGYRLLNDENDAEAAALVFKAQIEEHPNEPNPYDSYADALIEQGKDEEAINNLNKSIDLLAGAEDNDFNNNLILASKSKLAKLKGLNKVFSFLEGNWKVETYNFPDGEKTLRFRDDVQFMPSKMNSALVMKMTNEEENWEGTQMIAYDAVNNVYKVARTNSNNLNGFQTAEMKIVEYSTNKLEMIETMENNDEKMKTRHVVERNGDEVEWTVYNITDEGEEKMVYRHMKKKS